MTVEEFEDWREFYKLFPFDDVHRFHRPAALLSRAGGFEIADALNWLQPDPATRGYSQADLNTFRAFGMKPPPRKQ